MLSLYDLLNTNGISNNVTNHLNWYDILSMILITKSISQFVDHPYIRYAMKYYKMKDGIQLTRIQANVMLTKIRSKWNCELVETAILANMESLKYCMVIPYDMIESSINNSYDDYFLRSMDNEIAKSIELSRASLYNSCYNGNNDNKIITFTESIFTYEHAYKTTGLTGTVLLNDSQINQIVMRTNMPHTYSYIFLRRMVHQRNRYRNEINI